MNETYNKFEIQFMQISKKINFLVCLIIIAIGLIGNFIILIVLNCELKQRQHSNKRRGQFIPSSILYVISLAVSDSLFLLTHLIEDILPNMGGDIFILQSVNKSNLFCKFIIYFRNSSRITSSYLIAFYACERFMVLNFPIKRAMFQNKRFVIKIIIFLTVISHIVTLYSFFINGVRLVEGHETSTQKYECDVLEKYKNIYHFIIFIYTFIGLIVPIFFVVFFNLFIAKVLISRKMQNQDKKNKDPVENKTIKFLPQPNRAIRINGISIESKKKSNIYSDRATLVLVLFSICFVVLNFPYILTWSIFFVPFKQGLLKEEDIYFRYSFVLLTETFHLTNFSINIFLYSFANKRFRQRIREILSFKK